MLLRSNVSRHNVSTGQLFRSNRRLSVGDRFRRWYSRPAFAPKPILDIKHIARNPGLYEQNCLDRKYAEQAQNSWKIVELLEQRRALLESARVERQRGKADQDEVKRLSNLARQDTEEGRSAVRERAVLLGKLKQDAEGKDKLEHFESLEQALNEEVARLALPLPNLSSTFTPNGDEPEVIEIIRHDLPRLNTAGESHVDIGGKLDILDFAGAATTSGWGWYYLKNEGALLEQALVQYAVSLLVRRGWQFVSPPTMVYSHIVRACGFQPRDENDEQQIYQIQQAEKDKSKPTMSLAATAEIPLAGMLAGKNLLASQLPLKCVAVSRCYRAEAGARGADTRGLYRVHEFTKVEMFAWTAPEVMEQEDDAHFQQSQASAAQAVFDEMIEVQKEILTSLGLDYRRLEMSATDLGATATRKQDIEAYFPSRISIDEGWGEVTSTSLCSDYQSRRLGTRVRSSASSQKLDWPYTVNGTAVAIPRVLAAILESHWNPSTQQLLIPKVLRPWIFGQESIDAKSAG